MHKIIAAAVLALSTLSSLQAFDLIVPAPGESEYVLLSEDDEVFRVDDSVFYKKGLNGEVLVERYSAGITVVSYKGGALPSSLMRPGCRTCSSHQAWRQERVRC